ncbi:MAG: transglycosylase domain-containing protein, partial [Terrimesophilobacter sp.]
AKLAIALDKRYTKNEILLGYLNITGFGGQTYGVQAAARQYFSIDAKDVTLAQAASLIAIVQQPTLQNLKDPKFYPANKIRRDQILGDMLEEGYINRHQYDDAVATKIEDMVKITPPSNGCLYAADAKFACDYARRLVPTLASLGASPAERQQNWARGGYQLYTSIDLNQQDVAQAKLDTSAPATETRFKLGAAATAVQPGTGRILLMAQNKIFDDSGSGDPATTTAVNFNTDKDYGGSSGFQTGSAYKIFALTNWLQTGHSLYDIVDGTPRPFPMKSFKASCTGFSGGVYAPGNDASWERGKMTVLDATRNSVNVAFVSMGQKLDLCAIRDDATAMGVHRADGAPLDVYPSSVLGTNEIAPLSMAGAIATIGANGLYCAPTIVDKLVGPDGSELPGQPKQCTQAIDPNIAATVAFALNSVMTAGTGTAGNPRDGVPIVGKTGTSEESHQNWLVATTTKVSLAVWVGNITGGQSLRKISVAGTNGYNTKFNIFRATMASLDTNPAYRGGGFPAPDPYLIRRPPPPPAPIVPPNVPAPPAPPAPPVFPGPAGLPPGLGNGHKP